MSIESARAFYERVTTDEVFKEQLQNAASDNERRATIQAAGYDFTLEDWEVVIDQLRQLNDRELSEAELEAAAGGVLLNPLPIITIYGPIFPFKLP